MNWIPVTERMPEIDYSQPKFAWRVTVLVAGDRGVVMEASWASNGYAKTEKGRAPRWERDGRLLWWTPTHWMPMPPPPQVAGTDKTVAMGKVE